MIIVSPERKEKLKELVKRIESTQQELSHSPTSLDALRFNVWGVNMDLKSLISWLVREEL